MSGESNSVEIKKMTFEEWEDVLQDKEKESLITYEQYLKLKRWRKLKGMAGRFAGNLSSGMTAGMPKGGSTKISGKKVKSHLDGMLKDAMDGYE